MKPLDAPDGSHLRGRGFGRRALLFVAFDAAGEARRVGAHRRRRPEDRRGQVIDVGNEITVIQVFEDTLGLARRTATITLTGRPQRRSSAKTCSGARSAEPELRSTAFRLSIGEARLPIWGAPINPVRRQHPSDFIETGVTAIDGMNTLVRGQKLPVFSGRGFLGSSSRPTSSRTRDLPVASRLRSCLPPSASPNARRRSSCRVSARAK